MKPSDHTPTSRYTNQNRLAWDEIADMRHTKWPDAAFFANGGSLLDEKEIAVAGDVTGLTLLHLQCATGEDTLSWAVQGAQATGVDLSPRQIELAQQKASAAGLDVRFIAADVYELPLDLQQATFDIVFTGGGAIVWLPDLPRWAQVVAQALRPGGRLIVSEEHPLAACLSVRNGQLTVDYDYFGRTAKQSTGWAHVAGGEAARETKYEFVWPLGDVVTAVAQAGLRIESLAEFPSQAEWRFGDDLDQVQPLPGLYILVARK